MYNSPEERAMIQAVAGNQRRARASSSASARTCPHNPQPARFRQKYNIRGPFADLRRPHRREQGLQGAVRVLPGLPAAIRPARLSLVLIGNSLLPIPEHPRIRHLGFLDDADKFDAMAAADLLIMPSYFESLSMVALEAWALGRPVLANGKCDVLKGQCIRSNAGLYYETLRASSSRRCARSSRTAGWPARSAGTAASSSATTTTGRSSSGSISTCSSGCKTRSRRRRREPLPGWFDAGVGADRAAVPRPSLDELPSARAGGPRPPPDGRSIAPSRDRRHRIAPGGAATAAARRRVIRDPSGARDARLRRRDRPRGARHPARAARGRLRVGDLRRDRRSAARAADARLPRAGRRQPPRQPAAPPLFARLEGVADGVRAARSDGAHLPQHHAAGVLRRRAPHAGAAVLPRPPRAARLRRPLRPRARRLGVQPPGSRGARLPAHRACCRSCPTSRTSIAQPNWLRRRAVRRRLDQHPVRRPGDRRTRRSRI